MNNFNFSRTCALLCVSGLLLWAAASALAQGSPSNFRVTKTSSSSITVAWKGAPGISTYGINYRISGGGGERHAGSTSGTSFTIKELKPSTSYRIYLDWPGPLAGTPFLETSGRTLSSKGTFVPKRDPLPVTCPSLPADIIVSGFGTHTQCKQVGAAGVAIPELMAQGILSAVDVFGQVDAEVRICFPENGRLIFLDAATSPRTQMDLPAERSDGMTCGRIDRIGTVVLLQGGDTTAVASDPAPAAVETSPPSSPFCQLRTTDYLSLRAGPSVFYARLDAMPVGAGLIATARAGDWYLVEYDGQQGWASGAYLTKSAGCDVIGESNRVFLTLEAEPDPDEGEAPADLLETEQPAATGPGAYELIDCRLTAGDIINLRAEPGTEHSIEAEIPFRTQLDAIDRSGDWFKVEYQGNIGWVNIDYVFRRGACG